MPLVGSEPVRGEDEVPGSDWPRSLLFLSFPSLSLLLLREEKVQECLQGKGNKESMHIKETGRRGLTKSWVLEGRSILLLLERRGQQVLGDFP